MAARIDKIVISELALLLKFSTQENYRFLYRPLYEFFRCKTVKKLGKVTVLQRKNSLSCQLRLTVKKLRKSQLRG